ncbi:calcium-binding protein E63-1 isoform X3 [Hermetia illucens]|nr:calcium-binding protein E63-1 isoform X3 [Hermetia illucens]
MLGSALLGKRSNKPVKKKAFTEEELRDFGQNSKDGFSTMNSSSGINLMSPSAERPQVSEEYMKTDLRTAFDLLDRNRDGRVTANELQFMLKNLGINVRDELIDDLIKDASHTGNGLINEAEFLQWVGRIQALREEPESTGKPDEDDDVTQDLIAAFRVFDRDGNGFISRDELQTAMEMIGESLTETQLTELLTIADLDKDGRINYEEFTRLLL